MGTGRGLQPGTDRLGLHDPAGRAQVVQQLRDRAAAHRVPLGADVQGEAFHIGTAEQPAGAGPALQHEHPASGAGQLPGGHQAARTGTHHDRVTHR